MTTERDEIDEMFAAYRRQAEQIGQQKGPEPAEQRRRRSSQFSRKLWGYRLTLAADTALTGVLVWLLCTHVSNGGDLLALLTTGVLIAIHAVTVVRRLVELKRHHPATTQPEEMLKYTIKNEEKRNQPVAILSRKVTIAAATVAILAISIVPVYNGPTMSAMRIGERAEIIKSIDMVLTRAVASEGWDEIGG